MENFTSVIVVEENSTAGQFEFVLGQFELFDYTAKLIMITQTYNIITSHDNIEPSVDDALFYMGNISHSVSDKNCDFLG